MLSNDIKELIKRRRGQMLVHSYLYYVKDDPIISDDQWQAWADELTQLQNDNPKLKIGYYDKEFFDWDGSTGMHLPKHQLIEQLADKVLRAYYSVDKTATI
jgi:hypothetical protein